MTGVSGDHPNPSAQKIDPIQKFDAGLFDKLTRISLDRDNHDYTVILYVVKDPFGKNDAKAGAKKNKDTLANILQDFHNAKKVFKAKALSFVIVTLPAKERLNVAKYDYVYSIGDGEAEIGFEMNNARKAILALSNPFTSSPSPKIRSIKSIELSKVRFNQSEVENSVWDDLDMRARQWRATGYLQRWQVWIGRPTNSKLCLILVQRCM